jgi:cytochrome c-type biogenesis protein CcmH
MAISGLAAGSVFAVLVPLLYRRSSFQGARAEFDLRVFRDQLAEVDRDVERGLIGREEAEAVRTEIGRRILALPGKDGAGEAEAGARVGRTVAGGVVAVLVPALAIALYLGLGAPGIPDQPFAKRTAAVAQTDAAEPAGRVTGSPDPAALAAAIERLQDHLRQQPDDVRGWHLLGRSALALGRYDDAVDALRQADRLSANSSQVAADLGEAIVTAGGGSVDIEAQALFERVLAVDPSEPRARYYLALARAQAGDLAGALQGWVDLIALSPPDAPWLPQVDANVAQVAEALGVDAKSVRPTVNRPDPAGGDRKP